MSSTACDLSILVPVLDERDTLAPLVTGIRAALDATWGDRYEILLVDDGSTDDSWRVMRDLAVEHPMLRVYRLRRNFGKATALSVGAREARGRVFVTMDADLQDDPREIPMLVAAVQQGTDLVSGWKRDRKDPLGKRLASRCFNMVTRWATGLSLRDFNCGLKAAHGDVYRQLPLYGELHRYVPVLAHSLGYRVGEVPVTHHPRQTGRSKYGFERFLRGMLDLFTVMMLTRYGRRPGHLFGGVGVLLGTIGFIALSYLTFLWFTGDAPIGNRPLLLLGILLEMLSLQLISMGMLAELILNRTPSPPVSTLVAEATGHDAPVVTR